MTLPSDHDPGAESDRDPDEEDGGPVGPFPSWRALYVAVILYTAAMIAILYLMTRLLDHSAG